MDTDYPRRTFRRTFKSKQIQALLVVIPVSEKYQSIVRDLFSRNSKQKIGLIPIESAGARRGSTVWNLS